MFAPLRTIFKKFCFLQWSCCNPFHKKNHSVQSVAAGDGKSYAKRKINQALDSMVEKIAATGGINQAELQKKNPSKQCLNCTDYEILIDELKNKFHISNRPEKIQILTMVPQSWSIKKTMEEFCASERIAKAARKLKVEEGILSLPNKKQGKKLSQRTQQKVVEFFEDEEFIRICPGKKDYVSIRVDGEKTHLQKRLILSNLKEMFVAYRNGPEIGFSKFCELRPKWCITVDSASSHSVCVCKLHQNVKLMLSYSPIKEDHKTLLDLTACNLESKDCMLHHCEECPGEENLKRFLEEAFQHSDPEDGIEFKQWVHTGRDTLGNKQLTTEEFIEELVKKISSLSIHHYI